VRVVILSSSPAGFASLCLPALASSKSIEIAAVIQAKGIVQRPWLKRWRKLRKIAQIGVLGAANGVRMRRWYDIDNHFQLEPLETLAQRYRLPFHTVDSIFSPRTVELFRQADANLGLSLGNGYIPRRVFSAPRLGMINIHHELLPEFQGAQSVIWQLHKGSVKTGFTIHRIDDHIDTGDVLYRQEIDITFRDTLEQTVAENYARLSEASRDALVKVLEDFEHYLSAARPQGKGQSFTTPSYWQFRRIRKMHDQLRTRAAEEKGRS
jgi:methionyl-tRNA formyltransferase